MVVTKSLKQNALAMAHQDLRLDSGRSVRYVAPAKGCVCPQVSLSDVEQYIIPPRKRSSTTEIDHSEEWEGVAELCQALDNIMEIEKDKELLADKRILEIGFSTALPSILALDTGATDIAIHCWNPSMLELYVKPTLQRNNVRRNRYKLSSGDLTSCKRAIGGQKFDVILAPELTNTEESDFEALHDILDKALAADGLILMSAKPYYEKISGNLPAFLDLVKLRGSFDAHVRWTSTKLDLAPRKVIQMTRTIR
jgi:hypothetical protein